MMNSGHDVCCDYFKILILVHHTMSLEKSCMSVCDWGREGKRVRLAFLVVSVVPCISQTCMFDARFKYQ